VMFCEDCTRRDVILLDDARENGVDPYWVHVECLDCETDWVQPWTEGGEN